MSFLLATDWTVPLSLLLLVAVVVFTARQIRTYHQVDEPARPDRHIPARERALLGDDWREPAADFFAESFIRDTRRRFAVMTVCGADPKKGARDKARTPNA